MERQWKNYAEWLQCGMLEKELLIVGNLEQFKNMEILPLM